MLDAQQIRDQLDQLAVDIEERCGQEQVVSGVALIADLESLRKQMETATPDLIGAYYGYLQAKERFSQLQERTLWAQQYFWPLFYGQIGILCGLLALGIGWGWVLSAGIVKTSVVLFGVSIACVWWGAVGASLAGLHAMYDARMQGELSQSLDAWLLAKQLIGGILGLLAGLLMQVTAVTADGHLGTTGVWSYLLAFSAGFSERKFLAFLQQKVNQKANQ